jgi:hypothetical protein
MFYPYPPTVDIEYDHVSALHRVRVREVLGLPRGSCMTMPLPIDNLGPLDPTQH